MDISIIVGTIVKIAIVVTITMLHVAYAVYFERKVIGHMQARLGPMRVGPHGLLQPIADFVKLFFKEDIVPSNADKPIFLIAPVISVVAALASLAVIPLWETFAIANINIGILYILALSSVGAYGIILAGWSSNSKYSFLGALRSSAQVISYEIAMGLSLVGVMMLAGSANLVDIVNAQSKYPFILIQPVAFFVFLMAAIAETNRAPFDLPEAETELVAGYFTEYSGIRFGLFFIAEYAGMFIMSAIAVICFFGGWKGPHFWILSHVPNIVWFLLKVYALIFFYYWIRATLPRYRYDQLMSLGWKLFIPLTLANIFVTGLVKLLY
ncbi:MAG: NADH-quinone oxidoreductase subunit NuoH [Thermodesulfovibrionia bacterium]|nr:NADH-quinone oxidoreductase subunit NuoH [Thermodesulfovibrionia bacterium]